MATENEKEEALVLLSAADVLAMRAHKSRLAFDPKKGVTKENKEAVIGFFKNMKLAEELTTVASEKLTN